MQRSRSGRWHGGRQERGGKRTVMAYQRRVPPPSVDLPAQDPFEVLSVSRSVTVTQLRQAYIEKTKTLHPDVNPERDTTDDMARVNEAYEVLKKALESPQLLRKLQESEFEDAMSQADADPFNVCTGPPIRLFVNPFECEVDPFMWRDLNEIAQKLDDVEMGLYRMGLRSIREYAIYYLTDDQLKTITDELSSMDFGADVQMTEYMVNTYCARARATNREAVIEARQTGPAAE